MPDMKDKILNAIHRIMKRKLNSGEAFPCAHSIEVAHEVKMNNHLQELENTEFDYGHNVKRYYGE